MLDFSRNRTISNRIQGDLIDLQRPQLHDQNEWCNLRSASKEQLVPWEPAWNDYAASPKGFRKRLDFINDCWRDRSAFHYFLHSHQYEQLVGAITLHNIRYGACMCGQIGYWVGSPFVRKGFMTEAIYLLLDCAFYSLALNRVTAACMPDNKPSISLMQKCGFSPEGIARQYLFINNVWEDHIIFSLLSETYATRQ